MMKKKFPMIKNFDKIKKSIKTKNSEKLLINKFEKKWFELKKKEEKCLLKSQKKSSMTKNLVRNLKNSSSNEFWENQ